MAPTKLADRPNSATAMVDKMQMIRDEQREADSWQAVANGYDATCGMYPSAWKFDLLPAVFDEWLACEVKYLGQVITRLEYGFGVAAWLFLQEQDRGLAMSLDALDELLVNSFYDLRDETRKRNQREIEYKAKRSRNISKSERYTQAYAEALALSIETITDKKQADPHAITKSPQAESPEKGVDPQSKADIDDLAGYDFGPQKTRVLKLATEITEAVRVANAHPDNADAQVLPAPFYISKGPLAWFLRHPATEERLDVTGTVKRAAVVKFIWAVERGPKELKHPALKSISPSADKPPRKDYPQWLIREYAGKVLETI